MFRIASGKGFLITFENGWTISVQFGSGNYCDNRYMAMGIHYFETQANIGAKGSGNAEIAAWDQNDVWYKFDGDDVKGYVTPDEVLSWMNIIAGLPKSEKTVY